MQKGMRSRVLRRRASVFAALALSFFAVDACALHRIDPGDDAQLAAGEGLLAVAVDTSTAVSGVRFRKAGTLFTGDILSRLPAGHTMQLYAVSEGQYQWSEVTLADTSTWRTVLNLADAAEYRFEVKAGRITYAGDLVLRPNGLLRSGVRLSNRSLPVIDWLQSKYPGVYARYPFVYSGYYPDPFPDFYRKARAETTVAPADSDATRNPPASGELPLPPKLLWAPNHVGSIALSPDGSLVAEVVREHEDLWMLQLIDIAAGSSKALSTSKFGFGDLQWKDDHTLLVTTPGFEGDQLHAFLLGDTAGDARSVQHLVGPSGGRVVDLQPEWPGQILYEAYVSHAILAVHSIDVRSSHGFQAFLRANTSDRLNKGVEHDLRWFADGHGRLRIAIATSGGDTVMMYGREGAFHEVMRFKEANDFEPLKLSYEGDVIYGLTDEGRDERDLVAYDLVEGKVTRTLYAKPGIDVVEALFDDQRKPIGVRYHEGGRLISEYFDERDRQVGTMLQNTFAKQTVAVLDRSRNAERMLLWTEGSDQPARLYYLDVPKHEAQLLDVASPSLEGRKFASTQLLTVHDGQGRSIDAFVTLPAAPGKRPLIVMPHGGPIGVSDALRFDADVQFLASLGYAVLQVNFRGSEGYGRAFREAGQHQFGLGIEDDIDAALQAALSQLPLDKDRMCMIGASYGGYSALYSAIRWPDRFRCVVSISGVSDRMLFFTASDGGRTAKGRANLERWIGNPNTELEQMVATSPLYQYRRLQLPVMLVHGNEDERVDFEHTRRLIRMLNFAHHTPVVLTFAKEGHSFDDPKDLEVEWNGIAAFLREHLDDNAATAAPAHVATAPEMAGTLR